MKTIICAMWDSQAQQFGRLVEFPNEAVCTRQFGELVNDGQSEAAKYPQDFAMYKLGDCDKDTGEITPCPMELIVKATSLVKQES